MAAKNLESGDRKASLSSAKSAHLRVESALKTIIEADLTRRVSGLGDLAPGSAFFSRGVIFSKSGNGTPFSRGVIFSKSGREIINEIDQEMEVLGTITTLDEVAFQDFASRLVALKTAKDATDLKLE